MLEGKGDSKESQDIKSAKRLLSDIMGGESEANELVRSYSKDVLIGGMSEEQWKEKTTKAGGEKLTKNWEKIQEQLDVVSRTVNGAPDVVQPEKKSLEEIMAEFVNPDGVLAQLSGAVNNLVTYLNGGGVTPGNENKQLRQPSETEKGQGVPL